jgi:uncharacterized membrane protein YbaN (DUF454 family)
MKAINTFDRDAPRIEVEASPGRIFVNAAGLLLRHGEALAINFTARVMRHPAVDSVVVDRLRGTFTITYDQFQRTPREALIEISDCLQYPSTHNGQHTAGTFPRGAIRTSPFQANCIQTVSRMDRRWESDGSIAPPVFRRIPARMKTSGVTRLFYLTAAGGCLSVAIVGLVVPGIPTLSLGLATSFFLVRSSPRLNEWLRESRAFGCVVRDFEDHGGIRTGAKSEAIILALAAGAAAVLLGGWSVLSFATVAVALVDLTFVLSLPTIAETALV